jgi:radical S-adenosyl methionine domain-containing protein 2
MKNTIPTKSEIVINWHITETCNYKCKYCYAKWGINKKKEELIHNTNQSVQLLEQIYQFFVPSNINNPLQQTMHWNTIRLNLAGGEPLLYHERASQIISYAKKLGFSVSTITNGSYLTEELVTQLAPQLSMLGLSIDSSLNMTNQKIGRANKHGAIIPTTELVRLIQLAQTLNPELDLKVNTVVNAMNWQEDLTPLIQLLTPKKWKVLKMLPTLTEDLSVSDAQFQAFVHRHQTKVSVMCAEDNTDMSESYIMIDPLGRFYQNSTEHKGYNYSSPIMDVGIAEAFSQVMFSSPKFCSRYADYLEQ